MKKQKKEKGKGFLWGVAHIGPQVDGACHTSEWYGHSSTGRLPEMGASNAYLEEYDLHHQYVQELGCNAMRIVIDWARVEPEEGKFDCDAIDQYRYILKDLHRRGITPFVGIFHWSLPSWFAQEYGMSHPKARKYFLRFATRLRGDLGEYISFLVILNEPMVYAGTSYFLSERPPFIKSPIKMYAALRNMIHIHRSVYVMWKKEHPKTQVGCAHLYNDIAPSTKGLIDRVIAAMSHYFRVGYMMHAIGAESDFLGINYYLKNEITWSTSGDPHYVTTTNDYSDPDIWQKYAEGFDRVLDAVNVISHKKKKPVYILENGKPSDIGLQDHDRQEFLQQHIDVLQDKINKGYDIRGYFHYCLMDSYEWEQGYTMPFGLISVDRSGAIPKLTCRESYDLYATIIRNHTEG